MKRSKMIQQIYGLLLHSRTPVQGIRITDSPVDKKLAESILNEIEKTGMLPPKRPDESPVGYGAAYLSDDEVMKNYFKFKHSWEPEDEENV